MKNKEITNLSEYIKYISNHEHQHVCQWFFRGHGNESFSLTPSFYENIGKIGHIRNEFLLPATFEKSIFNSEKYGFVDLTSNLKVRNYQVDKKTNFLVNSFDWKSNKWINKLGLENRFEGLLKNVNYESSNTEEFKDNQKNVEVNPA